MCLKACLLAFPKNTNVFSNSALILSFLLLAPGSAFAQKKTDLEQKKKNLQKEIQITEGLLNETKQNKKLSLNQLVTLNQKISKREELIRTINSEINTLQKQADETRQVIESLKMEIVSLKQEYANMIYYAYKNKNSYDRLMFLFSSKDFNQAYRRLKYLQQYSDYRKKQADAIVVAQLNLDSKIAVLKNMVSEKQALLSAEEIEKGQLAVEKVEQEGTLNKLQNKEKELLAAILEKEKEQRNLQLAIQRVIEEEMRKERELAAAKAKAAAKAAAAVAAKSPTPTSAPVAPSPAPVAAPSGNALALTAQAQKLSATFETNRNKLPWPVNEGVITGKFGEGPHPVLKGIVIKNNGVDIATKIGSEVRAVFDGEVTGIVSMPGYGKVVIIRHGEYLSVYSNLQETSVKYGDKISTKQTIGSVITDEINAKTEVHFEIYKGQTALNPEHWLFSNN
jgi:murein hydrolase activator